MSAAVHQFAPAAATPNRVPLGRRASGGIQELDLDRLLAGRMLVQGSSGAGKSRTLRRIVEEAFDYVTTIIVDPEGEFGNLAEHIGATGLRADDYTAEGLTAAAARSREHRLSLHLDLTDLDPDERIVKAASFFAGLVSAPREHWANTTLVCVDEAHLLAPFAAASVRDADARRLGVASMTDLVARGRKRGIATVIATQRLAKLSASVTSELQNFIIGLNVFDRDIQRAGELLGFSRPDAEKLRSLDPGMFYVLGPALSRGAEIVKIDDTVTEHLGATPELRGAQPVDAIEAQRLLALDELRTLSETRMRGLSRSGTAALDSFLLDPIAPVATRAIAALRQIAPSATTAVDLVRHLGADRTEVDRALDVLASVHAIDTVPRGENRLARLSTRLRQKTADLTVVGLS